MYKSCLIVCILLLGLSAYLWGAKSPQQEVSQVNSQNLSQQIDELSNQKAALLLHEQEIEVAQKQFDKATSFLGLGLNVFGILISVLMGLLGIFTYSLNKRLKTAETKTKNASKAATDAAIEADDIKVKMIQQTRLVGQQFLIQMFVQQKNYSAALNACDDLHKEFPENDTIQFYQAQVLKLAGKLEEAKDKYKYLINRGVYKEVCWFNLGEIYTDESDHLRALQAYNNAILIKPDYAEAHFNKGTALSKLSHFEDALVEFDKTIEIKPDYAGAYFCRGLVLSILMRHEEAIEAYNNAIRIDPDNAEVYLSKGTALAKLGHLEDALVEFDKTIEIKPNFAEAYFGRGLVLSILMRYEEAIISYDNAIKNKPDYAEAHLNKGTALAKLSHLEDAIVEFDKTIKINPEDAEAFYKKGLSLSMLQRYEEAIISYDNAIRIKPDYTEAYYNKGNVLAELNKYEEAIEAFDIALRIKPDFAEAYNNKGVTLNNLKRYEEAIEAFDYAINIKPDYAEAYYNKGIILGALKEFNEAYQNLIQASELDKGNSSPIYYLAALFAVRDDGKRDRDTSLQYLRKAIEMDNKYKKMARENILFLSLWDDPEFIEITKE